MVLGRGRILAESLMDQMDRSSRGRYNHQESAECSQGYEQCGVVGENHIQDKLDGKQGHVTDASIRVSKNSRFKDIFETSCSTSGGLLVESREDEGECCEEEQKGTPSNGQKDSSEVKVLEEQTAAYDIIEQNPPTSFNLFTEAAECLVFDPPLGVRKTKYTTMGNKTSSSNTCTCKVKVEDQKLDPEMPEKSRHSQSSRKKGRNSKSIGLRESKSKEKPNMNESLSDVFQNLQIHHRDTEVPRDVLYYAWFLDPDISVSLKTIAHKYLTECLRVNQFERFIQSMLFTHKIQDPLQLYKKPGKRKPDDKLEYHVTAKFCDRKQCLPYQENVQCFVGSKFRLHIVGLFFTEKTFGFRVKLTAAQKALFDERRASGVVCTKQSEKESVSHEFNFNWEEISKLNEIEMTEDKGKDPKCKSDIHKSYSGIILVRQKEDFHPTESRAHITIGCAPFVKAFQTGEDLVDILDLEMRPKLFHQDFQIEGATLRQFGRNATAFVIYPHHAVIVEAIFNIFR